MKTLRRLALIRKTDNYLKGNSGLLDPEEIEKDCEEFEKWICKTLKASRCMVDTLRILLKVKAYLTGYLSYLKDKDDDAARTFYYYLNRLVLVINAEIEIVYLKIRNPEICNPDNEAVMYLEEITQTDFIEMITPLYLMNIGRKPDKSKADFRYMVEKLGGFFGMRIKNPDQLKRMIFNRKDVTQFLDKMREVMIEESMR